MDSQPKKRSSIYIFGALLIFLMIIYPLVQGFSKKGFDSNYILLQFFLYGVVGIASIIGLMFVFESLKSDPSEKYGSSVAFYSAGEFPSIKGNFFKSNIRTILIFAVIFTAIGSFSIYNNTMAAKFPGVASFQRQQFSPVDNIIYNDTLVVIAENLGAAFVLALTIYGVKRLAEKFNFNKLGYLILVYFFGILSVAVYGILNHLLRYGDTDAAILYVAFFWGIGAFITLLIGNAIPFIVMHMANNTFGSLKSIFSSQEIFWGSLVFIAVCSGLLVFLFMRRRKKEQFGQ